MPHGWGICLNKDRYSVCGPDQLLTAHYIWLGTVKLAAPQSDGQAVELGGFFDRERDSNASRTT